MTRRAIAAGTTPGWYLSRWETSEYQWELLQKYLLTFIYSQMIEAYAASEAAKPDMWGGRTPEDEEAQQLAACFAYEWNRALEQMLRHWDTPPTTTGYWVGTHRVLILRMISYRYEKVELRGVRVDRFSPGVSTYVLFFYGNRCIVCRSKDTGLDLMGSILRCIAVDFFDCLFRSFLLYCFSYYLPEMIVIRCYVYFDLSLFSCSVVHARDCAKLSNIPTFTWLDICHLIKVLTEDSFVWPCRSPFYSKCLVFTIYSASLLHLRFPSFLIPQPYQPPPQFFPRVRHSLSLFLSIQNTFDCGTMVVIFIPKSQMFLQILSAVESEK